MFCTLHDLEPIGFAMVLHNNKNGPRGTECCFCAWSLSRSYLVCHLQNSTYQIMFHPREQLGSHSIFAIAFFTDDQHRPIYHQSCWNKLQSSRRPCSWHNKLCLLGLVAIYQQNGKLLPTVFEFFIRMEEIFDNLFDSSYSVPTSSDSSKQGELLAMLSFKIVSFNAMHLFIIRKWGKLPTKVTQKVFAIMSVKRQQIHTRNMPTNCLTLINDQQKYFKLGFNPRRSRKKYLSRILFRIYLI